jgi:starch-binding outer membrane protein, SusD/RagB family
MKNLYSTIKVFALLVLSLSIYSCEDLLTTQSSTDVSDGSVLSSAGNLNMVLTSCYRQLYFNFNGDDRVYAGLTGLQMYVDLSGPDVICHTNMGGNQLAAYEFATEKTYYTGSASSIWSMCYRIINQANIIIDNIDAASGTDELKKQVKGQALAIRGICYFTLIQNYQQTYIIAKSKPGVILRTSTSDPSDMPRSTVEQCYTQIVNDLSSAKTLLQDFDRSDLWTIDKYVVSGVLARVYLVMQDWTNALDEATTTYSQFSTLMTREQYRSGFDDAITNGYPEIAWAVKFTDTDNLGGGTQFNFWFNQDASYGEGFTDGPIYSFLEFFADGEFEKLFEKTEDRYQFWKRTNNANTEWSTKWAYDKYKHYGDANGAVQGNTRPEVSLMRGSEMLLIMAEASAHINNGLALTYLTRLQSARGVTNLTTATGGTDLLDAIYIERRKELCCEGVSGMYDLLRLQKPLVRKSETATYVEGQYSWGLTYMDGYVATDAQPVGTIPSNDYRFICQIPQMELANNSALTQNDQNPFSGQ